MILNELIKGNENFRQNQFLELENDLQELVEHGQKPEVLFIGCSDSRVTPDLMLNSKPGDMFILRNVGNFVPPYKHDEDYHGSAAAIEYAVAVLKVKHIIVCGHSHCGACKSLYEEIPDTKSLIHVKTWLKLGAKAKERTLKNQKFNTEEEKYRATERNSIRYQLENLLTYPDVKRLLEEGKLKVHGWYYDIQTAKIDYFDSSDDTFKPLSEFTYEP
ncbi:carbonic anhydrase [Halarcobacter bivalviorum]|uniref:Carbonic anhydrase n=1 Tax=Halarcobacter bivalviorum TaxID=663364 RepID=A0AAX2A777_9BACT|nr:carbonic anhydrase [Halarcobacter bivalviorum]AXH13282.1 beta carbonic anhydrase, clade B [Halarcobacter bivalviorum]RXK04715.1 carbonic anhydrase [Halarcobacter bivalviorum]RXK10112.1 carbonic anhydrase [Halarcobacter bivalviorum]